MKSMGERVREVVEILGRNGGIFQFRDVRSALRISAKDRNQSGAAYEAFRTLIDGGFIKEEPSPDGRKRHRHYRIAARNDEADARTYVDETSGGETVVELPDGKSLDFWATGWEVRDGHLSLVREEKILATFAPGAWTSCIGDTPLEWAYGIEQDPRAGA